MIGSKSHTSIGFDKSALDPSFKSHSGRGIGRYVQELLSYLRSSSMPFTLDEFSHTDFHLPSPVNRVLSLLPAGRQTVRQQMVYPFQLASSRFRALDFLHFPAHMDAPSWATLPTVVTVLDLIPLVCADLYSTCAGHLRFRFARYLELRAMQRAVRLLAISEVTARDITKYLRIPPERIRVTPLGVANEFFAPRIESTHEPLRQRYRISTDRPLLLYVGGIDQRKNVPGLLRIFHRLHERRREARAPIPSLLLVGRISDDRNYPALCQQIQSLGLMDSVQILGYVSHQDLLTLYEISDLFIFLSLYEGFGLPPLEAMARGTPVVSSSRGALGEVLAGSSALLVDPDNEMEIAHDIDELLTSKEALQSRGEQGRAHALRFTWSRTGETTVAAYEELLIRGMKKEERRSV
jgi:glycosyltransferase involved in cell wall biosynthesis